ncbi:uncharacterized protein LOC110721154 [Chenopodium quinoa]|uniref:uncharacterized protein LOC110721154 n=1 Tax=Chenopodium quinoa TaxID=63459 RepID=UPI000B774ABC|nr:uncharacterized protein LOC110721154 [Chenopodium quinoa]
MALVQRLGKPGLFVTMTCNVKWPEITAELCDSETVADQPDVVARVFKSKVIALKKQTMEEKVLGRWNLWKNTGEHVRIRGSNLDKRWVIPYNPYLSLLFDCHLNVEVCSTIQVVKDLYKYVYKGHDYFSFNVVGEGNEGVDEMESFQAGRWVSQCEAAWRIFGFDLFEMTPIMLLLVHLPNMQTIYIRSHERLDSIVENE